MEVPDAERSNSSLLFFFNFENESPDSFVLRADFH